MTPHDLEAYLLTIARRRLPLSLMIWGPPGIGKSSIVASVAHGEQIGLQDLRLSQLAPTDLRGLPVPENGVSRWYPPEFLPRSGEGILFLDEINMAPPAMQGVAQQLILDRRVGSYTVPDGWLIWAAGNRKSDRASVYDMPSALGNRFIHLQVEPNIDSFKRWAMNTGIAETILAFLAFRPELLHRIDPQHNNWPSPRSWSMAHALLGAKLDIAPAIGEAAAGEYRAFCMVYKDLPDLDAIVAGEAGAARFLAEPSARYATILGLVLRSDTPKRSVNALRWLIGKAGPEWLQLYFNDVFRTLRENGMFGDFARIAGQDPAIKAFLAENRSLVSGAA